MENGRYNLPNTVNPGRIEIQCSKGGRYAFVISPVVDGVYFSDPSLAQEVVEIRVTFQMEFRSFTLRRTEKELDDKDKLHKNI